MWVKIKIKGTEIKTMKNDALIFENIYNDKENYWFTGFDYNSLFKMNKKDKKVKFAGVFPDEVFMQQRLYISTVLINESLYFAPFNAKEIAIYNIKLKKFNKLKIPKAQKKMIFNWEGEKFFRVIEINDGIYFIPYRYPGILYYDIKNSTFTCFDDWVDKIEELRTSEWGYFMDYVYVENKIILPCTCTDAVVIFDLSTEKSRIIRTPHTEYKFKHCSITYINKFFYLVTADGTVFKRKLKAEKEEIKVFKLPQTDVKIFEFYPVCLINEYIYLFPFKKNKGYKIDTRTDKITEEKTINEENICTGSNFSFLTAFSEEEKIFFVTGNSRYLIEYNLQTQMKQKIQLYLSDEIYNLIEQLKQNEFKAKLLNNKDLFSENDVFSLECLLYCILTNFNFLKEKKKKESVNIENEIYSTLKKLTT